METLMPNELILVAMQSNANVNLIEYLSTE